MGGRRMKSKENFKLPTLIDVLNKIEKHSKRSLKIFGVKPEKNNESTN